MNKLDFNKDKLVLEVYGCAIEVFCKGIAVPTENHHPCGWSWIDFEYIDEDEILNYKFECDDIDNGLGNDEIEGKTLKEILLSNGGKFAFEVQDNVDWFGVQNV